MPRWLNVTVQVGLGIGQVGTILTPLLDEKGKLVLAAAIAAAQLVVSAIAHSYNPDGTNARAPYEPGK